MLYADDGVKKGSKFYTVTPCPTCGNMLGVAIGPSDMDNSIYCIGDTPLEEAPAYEWDWLDYKRPNRVDGEGVDESMGADNR
jgi:hypothetical protein